MKSGNSLQIFARIQFSRNAIFLDDKYLALANMKGLHIKLTTTGKVRDVSLMKMLL